MTVKVVPQGPAGDQAYTITIEDSRIAADAAISHMFDPSNCVKVQSSAVTAGEAVVVVQCLKDGDKCKECETTASVTVTAKGGALVATEKTKINCHR